MTSMSHNLSEKNAENEGVQGMEWVQAQNKSFLKLNLLFKAPKNDVFRCSERKLDLYEK